MVSKQEIVFTTKEGLKQTAWAKISLSIWDKQFGVPVVWILSFHNVLFFMAGGPGEIKTTRSEER